MRSLRRVASIALIVPAVAALAACSSSQHAEEEESSEGALTENNAKIVGDIGPNAVVEGTFDPRVRVYGYIVSAKAGAKITAKLEATAGADARRDGNSPLDTEMFVTGPYASNSSPGGRLATSDDGEGTQAAPPVTFKPDRDGKFLVAFTSHEDTGAGKYRLTLGCEGTDLQCAKPAANTPCTAGQLFVQGANIDTSTTWDKCEVVLLEAATVKEGATLTIKPGVNVKGNFIGQGGFGSVALTVNGLLQAQGTKENPVAFTAFSPDHGWSGIVINSVGNSISNAVIEKANVGVLVQNGNLEVADVLVQGVALQGQQPQAGIQAAARGEAKFTRAVVKGFQSGLRVDNAAHFTIVDSVVRENQDGVVVIGQNGNAQCFNASPPQVWRDPVIDHTDIIKNRAHGVFVLGSDVLVQVSKSNIVGNTGLAIEIQGAAISPQSFFRENNVYDNNPSGGSVDVQSYHRSGTLDVSKNYWKDISDPQLSANWRNQCANNSFTFTGFSPTPIADAGPRKETLIPRVKEQCFSAQ